MFLEKGAVQMVNVFSSNERRLLVVVRMAGRTKGVTLTRAICILSTVNILLTCLF